MNGATPRLEQLVHTWANSTLEGSGAGIVACSPGWPTSLSSIDPLIASLVDYLPQGATRKIHEGVVPPAAVEFRIESIGRFVAVTRYAGSDSNGRPGRSITRILFDASGTLSARAAWQLTRSPVLTADWPLDTPPDSALPRVEAPGGDTDRWTVSNDEQTRRLAGRMLTAGFSERPIVIVGDSAPESRLESVLAVLPERLTRDVTFSTFRSDPSASQSDVSDT
jgi:hypothetical protein